MYIDETKLNQLLTDRTLHDTVRIQEALARAEELKGLELADLAALTHISDPELTARLFEAARRAKNEIYGRRMVLFAPLYVSSLCGNECLYCTFRAGNRGAVRRTLTRQEISAEVAALVEQGHKRVLLVSGEEYPEQGFSWLLDAIETIYATSRGTGQVRRVNLNVAPLATDAFRLLANARIGTYQLFQETYHRPTYAAMHPSGRKKDFDWRALAMHRAMEAGIHDVGIGALFGLYDWRFELLAMMQHIQELEQVYGIGPHTISVPRLEPADGSSIACRPPAPVSDTEFRKIIAILRLAVPYTGIIISTRETPEIRRDSFALGVSQLSAGSSTTPGGYAVAPDQAEAAQFSLGDHRTLDEVIRDLALHDYIPSFCTGCYRLGRVGADFMDLARPGAIKEHCDPNALSTFMEYLLDYASPATKAVGLPLVERLISGMAGGPGATARRLVAAVASGKRDVYC